MSTPSTEQKQDTLNNSNIPQAPTALPQVSASAKAPLGAASSAKVGILFQAPTTNTDKVVIGDASVTTSLFFFELAPGERWFMPCPDVSAFYMLPRGGTQVIQPSLVG